MALLHSANIAQLAPFASKPGFLRVNKIDPPLVCLLFEEHQFS